jgi:hypothetical protein
MDNKITTYSKLYELVDIDTKDHKLKDIATLFLNAMNDWPTFDQKEITDFTKELARSCWCSKRFCEQGAPTTEKNPRSCWCSKRFCEQGAPTTEKNLQIIGS